MKLISGRIVALTSLLVAVALLFNGCATTSDPTFTSSPSIETSGTVGGGTNLSPVAPDPNVYRFKVADMVVVVFTGGPTGVEIQPHQERIKEDGYITLPLIGSVQALGKTAGELQKEIHGRYVPKYYVRLNVVVVPPVELFYHVVGEVRSSGPKQYLQGTTVTKAIATAGGLSEFANKRRITLTRQDGTTIKVDYSKAIERPEADPQVRPGDRIHVPRRRL